MHKKTWPRDLPNPFLPASLSSSSSSTSSSSSSLSSASSSLLSSSPATNFFSSENNKETLDSKELSHIKVVSKLFSPKADHTLKMVPPGQIGKLLLYKSGRAKLQIGDMLLEVTGGTTCLFHQEFVTFEPSTKQAHRLGGIDKRLVCTLDVDHILSPSTMASLATTTSLASPFSSENKNQDSKSESKDNEEIIEVNSNSNQTMQPPKSKSKTPSNRGGRGGTSGSKGRGTGPPVSGTPMTAAEKQKAKLAAAKKKQLLTGGKKTTPNQKSDGKTANLALNKGGPKLDGKHVKS